MIALKRQVFTRLRMHGHHEFYCECKTLLRKYYYFADL